MVTCDIARLDRGETTFFGLQVGFDVFFLTYECRKIFTCCIMANDGDKSSTATKREDVPNDVPCTTQHGSLARDLQDWHGCFRRDAGNLTINEMIENQIADTKYLTLTQMFDMGGKYIDIVRGAHGAFAGLSSLFVAAARRGRSFRISCK